MNIRILTLAALVAACAPAWAQFNKPEDAIRYRQAAYALMGNHMGRINAQLKQSKPDPSVIQRSAETIQFVAGLPNEAYVAGSETGGNPATRAKPEIFTDPKVREVEWAMRQEVLKLAEASRGGDLGAVRSQFEATAKACSRCHDDYRRK